VNIERPITLSADPAGHDPSEGRPEDAARQDAAPAPDRTDRYLRLLDHLVDVGMEQVELRAADFREEIAARSTIRATMVTAAVAAAEAAAPGGERGDPVEPEPTPDATLDPTRALLPALQPTDLAFQRLSRSIRLSMALALRFQNDRLDRAAGIVKTPKPPRQPASPREQVERKVKEAIERGAERDRKEILLSELREILEEEDIEDELDRCSPKELAVRICQDLGAGPDGEFRRGEPVIQFVIVDPPHYPDAPFREQRPPEPCTTTDMPEPPHRIAAGNRKPPSG